MQQRRLDQIGEHDEHVHRHVGRQADGADAVGQPHAPIDFHGARVGALHLRQEQRRFLLLDERAAHAAHAEIDGEREPGRTGAGNDDLCVHGPFLNPIIWDLSNSRSFGRLP